MATLLSVSLIKMHTCIPVALLAEIEVIHQQLLKSPLQIAHSPTRETHIPKQNI